MQAATRHEANSLRCPTPGHENDWRKNHEDDEIRGIQGVDAITPKVVSIMGLRDLRIARGMTQRDLAENVGLLRGRIGDYETGSYNPENMTLALAIKMGDALHVRDLRKLVEPDETPHSRQKRSRDVT